MLGLSKARIDKLGLARLLRPSRYNDTVHLNFLQPYDPKRIPVLMVHGLDSTPATFAPMYFQLLQDTEIRENYQFWANPVGNAGGLGGTTWRSWWYGRTFLTVPARSGGLPRRARG